MFASINPNSKWYGVVMISVRKEYWWVGCGGEGDGCGVVEGGDGVVVIKCVVCL